MRSKINKNKENLLMAINHTAENITLAGTSAYTPVGVNWKVIRTKINYIRPRIINQPIINTGLLGINGGFFSSGDYNARPSYGVSINWNQYGTDNYLYNGISTDKISRGTLFIYEINGIQYSQIISAAQASDVLNYAQNATVMAIIGGGDLALGMTEHNWYWNVYKGEQWDNLKFGIIDTALVPTSRTGIGIKTEGGENIAYLAVSTSNAVLADLRQLFDYLGCHSAIFLDGSGSSQYRYKDSNNNIVAYGGTDSPSRYIWNMIQITNVN